MAVEEFYVTLPSNSSSAYYPDNTLSDFTTKLFKPIDLTGEWEVALTEISFPHSFYNITEPFNRILYSGNGSPHNVKTFNIPPGYYHDLKELFLTMHDMMDDLGQRNIKLTLNKNTQKVKVKLDGGAFIEFRAELAAMLGFVGNGPEKLVSVRHLNTHDAELPIDLNAGMYSLYLYSDIVEDQLVGDVFAPLLRIVHGKDRVKGGDMVTRTYENPHFVKVKMKRFDTINMHIRRDTGEKISFQRGKVIVKLCFRFARSGYFNRRY